MSWLLLDSSGHVQINSESI